MSDWIKTAKVGDKVVCINDEWPGFVANPLQAGAVYTIAEITPDRFGWNYSHGAHNGPGLRLVETQNNLADVDRFTWLRFRPVTPRKTDISFAHEILRKASKPVEECV
jgi:hypothetical protein